MQSRYDLSNYSFAQFSWKCFAVDQGQEKKKKGFCSLSQVLEYWNRTPKAVLKYLVYGGGRRGDSEAPHHGILTV